MSSSKSTKKVIVGGEHEGCRVDVFIATYFPEVSRTKIQKHIEKGEIFVNDIPAKKSDLLKVGDVVEIEDTWNTSIEPVHVVPQDIDLDILYEDEYFVAVNKPAGMVVHPGSGNPDGTLVNALLFHLDSLSKGGARERPGIVHRLDKGTSGMLIAAKNDEAHNALADLFAKRSIKKEYIGICIGKRPRDFGRIDAPVARSKNNPVMWCVKKNGKEAVTDYKLLSYHSGISLMSLKPLTGRTHQIRIHCSYLGLPIVGDSVYGGVRKKTMHIQPLDRAFAYKIFKYFSRPALHARRISFIHPFTNKHISFEAPFPEDFRQAIDAFGNKISFSF